MIKLRELSHAVLHYAQAGGAAWSVDPWIAPALDRDAGTGATHKGVMHRFDDLDRRLVAALREDARIPITRLAAALKISRATAQARLDRLLESGAVLGFSIRSRQDNEGFRAIMTIEIEGRSTTAITRRLRGFAEIEQLHTTNGAWDLVAEIRAANIGEFDRILREIRQIDGILNSETSILLSSI